MAFQDFDHISERRKNERKQKLKKRITIAVVSSVVLLLIVGAAVCAVVYKPQADNTNVAKNNGNGKSPSSNPAASANNVVSSDKAIKMICSQTDYKDSCETHLTKAAESATTAASQPKDLLKAAISVVWDELDKVINQTSTIKFETEKEKAAYEDCMVLLQDAKDELNSSMSSVDVSKLSSRAPELNNWLSAVISYQQTCIDGFPEGNLKSSMQTALKGAKELTSNALSIVSQMSSLFSSFHSSRRLMADEEGVPSWMDAEERRMLKAQEVKLTPDVVVAKDGSGKFKTITEALAAMPKERTGRYVIYIKEGVYDESVTVEKKMVNVTMFGAGSQKTIITGSKNFVDGVPTFRTATFAALGDGFMAQSMGFRNTAGPEKHQAVALRVQSDRSVFLNCRMEGFQDTLYAQTHRQYYRSCLITGTVDFIFGDAASIFQNCNIYVRKPMDNQQNIVTAQGRIDKRETTGIVLQNCKIMANDQLEPVKANFKTYLGRPWKEYSRTIVMESDIGDLIHPDGWMPWNGDFALNTLYYAEYNNKGAGSSVNARVKWAGYKSTFKKEDAAKYTVGPFIQGQTWLNKSIPVHYGLFH